MTLYRKYRPKNFSEVVGREAISGILAEEIRTNHIAHAYLFSGTRGTGKTTIARIFAKSLNCESRDEKTSEPCNKCASCEGINQARSQDLVEIDAASNRRIEEIRELREHVKYVPASSLYKVYIIDEVHMLTQEAFNALLKTLEEPPKHVVFILATTELNKIPETIFSRCQHFSFGKLPISSIVERLNWVIRQESAEIDQDVVQEIARRASGSARDAESLLGQILSIGAKKITWSEASMFLPKVGFSRVILWLKSIESSDAKSAIKAIDDLERDGVNLVFFLSEALETARQMMVFLSTSDEDRLKTHFTADEIADIKKICENSSPQKMRSIVVELLRAQQEMKFSGDIPSLPVEIAIVLLCEAENKALKPEPENIRALLPASARPAESYAGQAENTEAKEVKQEKQSTISRAIHSLEDILDGWGEVLTKVKDKNQALNFVLGVAQPMAVAGNVLEIGFKYRLQKEKIAEIKNRQIVENIIKEVYGTEYRIEPTLNEDIALASPKALDSKEEDGLMKAALQVFEGAEIIS